MKRLLLVALAITGILAAGCIVRFGSLYTQDDTSHFVGLASNLSKVDVVNASVRVDFFDSSNHLLDTQFVPPCTRTLQIGQDAPIEVVPRAGTVANHVQTTVQWLTLGHKTVADLDVKDVAVSTAGDETHITGTIKVGDDDLEWVNVCAALLDNSGNVVKVGHHLALPYGIDSGDDGTFDVAMESDSNATKFELWIDAMRGSDPTAPVVVGPSALSQFATDTGLLSPTDDEAGVGTTFNNPDRAFASDNKYATVITATTQSSEVYEGYGARDQVPSGATITGIAVRADWKVSATNGARVKVELSWDGGTSWSAPITSLSTDASTSETTLVLGGSTEDWGHTWTRSQLSDSNFRVQVIFFSTEASDITFSLDWIPVTVYFTTS